MGFTKKTWKNRIAEYINRRLLTNEDGSTELVTVARDEGTISQEGDAFNAANMNDLEDRIEAGFTEVNQSLTNLPRFEKIDFTISNSSETLITYPDGFDKDNTSVISLIVKTSNIVYHQIPIFTSNASYSGNSFMNQSVFYKDDGIHFYNAQSTYRGKSAVVRVMRF